MYVLGWDTESRIIIFYGELKYFPTNALSPCVLLKHNNIKTTQYQIRKTHMHKQKCHYGLWWIKILSNKYTINQKVNEKDELNVQRTYQQAFYFATAVRISEISFPVINQCFIQAFFKESVYSCIQKYTFNYT